jgi:hypothetical protein
MSYASLIVQYLGLAPVFHGTPTTHSMSQPGSSDFLGVYHAVDPSTYSDIYPTDPSPQVKKVAGLYTDIIQLFVDMRYLKADSVHFPPHQDPAINNTFPAKYGFSKDVVDLYQMIPYVKAQTNWNYGSDAGEFLKWGEFPEDLRGSDKMQAWLHQTIDPTYALYHHIGFDDTDLPSLSWDDPSGPYIRPFYAVLSSCGNHGSIMIVDTRSCRSNTYHRPRY